MDEISQIKRRLNIVDIIGSYIPLKKMGRSHKACCPFHKEKTPSFTVSEEKQLFYCFGCGTGGDVFKFVELQEKMDFKDVLNLLADKAGVTLEKKSGGIPKEKKDRIKSINEESCTFFEKELQKNPQALKYFKDRGLTEETIKTFRLGYAPDQFHALHTHLEEKGYAKKEILLAGVASNKETATEDIFDRFRNRIIFPITSAQGDVIAFGGRVLDDSKPKYLNSSDSPIYKKSEVVFALAQARESIRSEESIIISEGYFDVITSYQNNVKNIVAPCGTALTEEQTSLLSRQAKKIVFAFDTDEAGQTATIRSINLAQSFDAETFVAEIPSGKDPDEFIQENSNEWKNITKNPTPSWQFLCKKIFDLYDQKSAKGVSNTIQDLSEFITKTKSPAEKEHYINDLSNQLKLNPSIIKEELNKKKTQTIQNNSEEKVQKPHFEAENILLGFILNKPNLAESIEIDYLPEGLLKKACKKLKNEYSDTQTQGEVSFSVLDFDENERKEAEKSLMYIEEKYANFSEEQSKIEFEDDLKRIYKKTALDRLSKVRKQQEEARLTHDEKREEELIKEAMQISTKIRQFS